MEFRRVWALRGPNIWARVPVLEALVELGERDRFSDLAARLRRTLPWPVRQATDPGDLLAQLSRELQARAGTPVEFARSEETTEPGVYRVLVAYEYESLGRACLETARRICLAAREGQQIDMEEEVGRLRALEYQLRPGPGTRAIVRAARARGLPVEQLCQPPGNLLQLG